MTALALVVFVCGAFYEASCVGFVHFSEGGSPWKTATMSMLAGAAEVTGIFGSVHDWHVGPFFVLGLGVGAFAGVTLKQRRAPEGPQRDERNEPMPAKMNPRYEPKTLQQKLGYLVEEAGEVLAAAGKTLRWGALSENPELPPSKRETNIVWLRRELADLKRAIEYVETHDGDLSL